MKFSRTNKMVIASVVMSLIAAATVMADDEVVAPVIVDQPKSVNVKAGARVTFSVNAVETTDSCEDFTVNLETATLDMIYCAPGSFTMVPSAIFQCLPSLNKSLESCRFS